MAIPGHISSISGREDVEGATSGRQVFKSSRIRGFTARWQRRSPVRIMNKTCRASARAVPAPRSTFHERQCCSVLIRGDRTAERFANKVYRAEICRLTVTTLSNDSHSFAGGKILLEKRCGLHNLQGNAAPSVASSLLTGSRVLRESGHASEIRPAFAGTIVPQTVLIRATRCKDQRSRSGAGTPT
jgi:hypothetical protein